MASSGSKTLVQRAGAVARRLVSGDVSPDAAAAAPARKTAAKKASGASAKKAAVKAATKKVAANATAAKKSAGATSAKKQAAAKKSTTKIASGKSVTKAAATKAGAKKAATTKAGAKKVAVTKAGAKKVAAKKTTPHRNAAPKATVPKKAATSAGSKAGDGLGAVQRSGPKSPASKSPASKSPASKPAAKKASSRRPAKRAARSSLVVLDTESEWTEGELDEVQVQLRDDVARIAGQLELAEDELHHLMVDSGDGAGQDQADMGSSSFERDQEMVIANNARDMLVQSQHALERISDGTYGVCESCGNPIGKKRLMAFPRATMCMDCKRREERH